MEIDLCLSGGRSRRELDPKSLLTCMRQEGAASSARFRIKRKVWLTPGLSAKSGRRGQLLRARKEHRFRQGRRKPSRKERQLPIRTNATLKRIYTVMDGL